MKRPFYVFVNGGLGNQLFQLSAALHLGNGRKICLIPGQENMRLEITSYEFGELDQLDYRKIYGLISRMLLSASLSKSRIVRRGIGLITNVMLSISIGIPIKVLVAKGGGDFELKQNDLKCNAIAGYFQSDFWASSVISTELKLKKPSSMDTEGLSEYSTERPLVLHIRLGDYLVDQNIGVLPKAYFVSAIAELWRRNEFSKIWLFSNQVADALEYIPLEFRKYVEVKEKNTSDPKNTLELMRHGTGYILSNSTFGWWAARTSYHKDSVVVSPSPWFKSIETPRGLIPSEWWLRKSGF
jgi:hypothetical protein